MKLKILARLCQSIIEIFYYSYRHRSFVIHPDTQKLIHSRTEQFIVAFWHSRTFYIPFSIHQNIVMKGHDILAMVSPSKDGEISAHCIDNWNAYTVSGSSSRKGFQAMRTIMRYVKLHFHPVLVVDGPRGPAYEIKKGVIFLAKISQLPIVPICHVAKKEWVFSKSWDKFAIPKPFTQLAVEYGAPIYFPKKISLEDGKALLQNKMLEQMERLQTSWDSENKKE